MTAPERPLVLAADEGRHPPGNEPLWGESWYFDFTQPDGSLGGWVRLGLYPNLGVAWYHAYVVRPGRPTVAVADYETAIPKDPSLEVRSNGLWAEHIGTHPLERWQVANEAQGVTIDSPAEAYRPGGPHGDLVPMALDLEWETDGEPYHYGHTTRYEVPCTVHGEVLLGTESFEVDGHGQRDHSWAVRDWWAFPWVWTSGRLDDGTRFHGSDIRIPDMRLGFGYLQAPGGGVVPAAWPDANDGTVASSEVLGDEGLPERGDATIAGLDLAIEPLAFAPSLLVSPDGRVDRFPRALCRFTAPDGRTGLGWTEWNQPQ
ncbi:MAG: hypothetical protein H0W25_21480 [Acidimicrobiia bacterium]|nr:hypothetical protein [Acidimicrobiia bacterium]